LEQGAVEPWRTAANRWWREELERLADGEGIPLDVPWRDLPAEARSKVWKGTRRLDGVEGFFRYLETKRYKMPVRVFLSRYRSPRTCSDCGGDRLIPDALAFRVGGRSIAEAAREPLDRLAAWIGGLGSEPGGGAAEILWRIEARLATMLRMGLHYLTLDRPSRTLSGGEMQRVNLARQLSNRLTRTLYVLDEPSIGLHARDVETLSSILRELALSGNTVLYVEHDLGMIREADHVVELGPGGGGRGGRIIFQGSPGALSSADTATGRHLGGTARGGTRRTPRLPSGWLTLRGCRLHNLKEIEAHFPLGVLTCVTGVSGSGKSTLVEETLVPAAASNGAYGPCDGFETRGEVPVTDVRLVDQEPMGRTPRSIPLTYIGAYGAVRELFASLPTARRLGLGPGHFSFNVGGGRCERCEGTGFEKLDMLFFEDLYVPCPICHGRRFKPEVLAVRRDGLSIHDVLGLTVDGALECFAGEKKIEKPLRLLADLGLGYLVLGQPANTLSGGEAQRLKIAAELLGKKPRGVLYVLDEPTTGLHAEDVERLRAILERLVEAGNSVIVVEHHLGFIASADWVVDLGPEGGEGGGRLVDAGTPDEVAARGLGPTGRWLAAHLAGKSAP
jgi:excinuclease ABC subunit A